MRYGLLKDSYDSRDHLSMAAAVSLPAAIDLSLHLGPVRDQGQEGSCTGQASGGFMDWVWNTFSKYLSGKLFSAEDMFSAEYIYARERAMMGTFPQDSGSDSRTAFKVLTQFGACLESHLPYDGNSGRWPTPLQDSYAKLRQLGAYHRVIFDDGLRTARSVLASGYCCIMGIPVYKSIESDEVAETGILPVPSKLETPVGGHELLRYGYHDSDGVELVRNSWGKTWGLQGNLKIPYDYYKAAGGDETCDSWVGHLGRPWRVK